MRAGLRFCTIIMVLVISGCAKKNILKETPEAPPVVSTMSLLFPGEERHFQNVQQLTFDGKNSEAYFSFDNRWLVYQAKASQGDCDQLYVMRTDGSEKRPLTKGNGLVASAFFVDADRPAEQSRIIYASTQSHPDACKSPVENSSEGNIWTILPSYEIYVSEFNGGESKRLTDNKFYDGEASVSPDGKQIVFTSDRAGDLDIYVMDIDGKNVRRLTSAFGYDGGAFFSQDGKHIIYRAFHPTLKKEKQLYSKLLKKGLFKPTSLELFMMDRDGTNKKRLTDLKAASFAPYLFPGNRRVIFSSNLADPKGRFFDLFAVNTTGGFLEKLTFNQGFDAFPMFSFDGKKVVWVSSRNGKNKHDVNVFTADWIE